LRSYITFDLPGSERYLKSVVGRIVGRTDVDDALKRLEDLTHDEALMTTAQVLGVVDNSA
jgi:hypothetical protein